MTQTVRIEKLGQRGEGVALIDGRPAYIPYTVPGDAIEVSGAGDHAQLEALRTPSPDRVEPFCPYFTRCGGCATQSVALPVQLEWKRGLVVAALTHVGLEAPVEPCVDAHGEGRRRATFHARRGADGNVQVGFMAARSHDLVAVAHCPLFAPGLADAVPAARAIATVLAATGKPLDIAVTATQGGMDVDVRGSGPLEDALQGALIACGKRLDVAGVSNHGRPVVRFRAATIEIGSTPLDLPPGGFLQATQSGEDALAQLVLAPTAGAKRIADLFSGVGTFALRLAQRADVLAIETDAHAIAALRAAAGVAAGLRTLRSEARDLVRRPLSCAELDLFDAIVFDPPRAGAAEQVAELARSTVPLVVGVSCNPQTFARDAKTLVDGGYTLERVTPVDQFRHSAHVELVGVFRRAKAKKKRKLLG